jgi:hypothetical protein
MTNCDLPDSSPERSPRGSAYHLEEFKSLRDEIAANNAATRETERLVALACFAIWVWVIRAKDFAFWPALVLPPVAVALGAWRAQALGVAMWEVGLYIRKLEETYGHVPPLGWERHFRGQQAEKPSQHRLGRTAQAFWWTLFVTAITFSIGIAWVLARQ